MSVRLKIFLGALGFLVITLTLGLFSQMQERRLGELAVDVYDHALVAVSYVQKVQTDFVRLSANERQSRRPFGSPEAKAELDQLLGDLDVAADQAISPKGKAIAARIRAELLAMRDAKTATERVAALDKIDADMSKLVRKYRADGLIYRVRVDDVVDAANHWTILALVLAAILTLVTTLALGHAIVPPIKHAVAVAKSIAAGKLDNAIDARGRSETAHLLASLAAMQASIAESVRQAEALREAEAARLIAEVESEAARKASRSKSEFLATMSHELRTPLNAIIGFSELLERQMMGPLSALYVGYAHDIHRSGHHLLSLINDVLDLSKLEAGKFELRESEIDLVATIGDSISVVREQAIRSRVAVEAILERPPTVWADERLLKQVLLNLLSNAVKFTPAEGHVTVVARESADGVEIEVRDTGVGMSPAEVEIALTPFGQIDSKVARKHQGTGLGLPISKSLMEAHGGDLRIESTPGVGTAVIITLPKQRIMGLAA